MARTGQDISKVRNQTRWNCPGVGEPVQTRKSSQPFQSCPVPCKGTESFSTSRHSPRPELLNWVSFGQHSCGHLTAGA